MGILTIQCFCDAADKIQKPSTNQKISMIFLYIKPELKKNDTTAMITAINEVCLGDYMKTVIW